MERMSPPAADSWRPAPYRQDHPGVVKHGPSEEHLRGQLLDKSELNSSDAPGPAWGCLPASRVPCEMGFVLTDGPPPITSSRKQWFNFKVIHKGSTEEAVLRKTAEIISYLLRESPLVTGFPRVPGDDESDPERGGAAWKQTLGFMYPKPPENAWKRMEEEDQR
ncbi:hypothetical protein Celaphus_00010350 [Cervus elaphus hippelaphus]|uniref:Uncharacterized protein n=1 Tax=Cervus elaphus hippelaphus TaxID=46360 RepID=A0A212C9K6_CEREH|nr:hypothetical protein Celaphus_00010350 [Cervus elaphus hippelaphus]